MMAAVIGQRKNRKEGTGKGKKRKGKVRSMVDPTWRLRLFYPRGGIDRLPSSYWAAPPPDHVRAGSGDPSFSKFTCPLSGFIMQDPVRTSDGETYDRGAIEFWFQDPLFFFFTLVTGPRRSLSPKLSDTRVHEPQIRARLGTTGFKSTTPTPSPARRSLSLSLSVLYISASIGPIGPYPGPIPIGPIDQN